MRSYHQNGEGMNDLLMTTTPLLYFNTITIDYHDNQEHCTYIIGDERIVLPYSTTQYADRPKQSTPNITTGAKGRDINSWSGDNSQRLIRKDMMMYGTYLIYSYHYIDIHH